MEFVLSLIIVAVICYFGYQKIRELERDIRQVKEQKADKPAPVEIKPTAAAPQPEPKANKPAPAAKAAAKPAPAKAKKPAAAAKKSAPKAAEPEKKAAAPAEGLEERLLQQVTAQPGMKQTEFYPLFPDEDRRVLQATLLSLDKAGKIRREKDKGTYLLYPA